MRKSLFIGLVAVLGLIGCSRNQEVDVPDANLSILARTESPAETKTVVESGVHVFWEPGDEIAVFTGEKAAKFTTDITAASGTATFKGTFGEETWPEDLDLWAVYPFSEDAVFDGETITTTLPSEQVAREGSFGKDMNLAIAHSSGTTLQFYNVGGGIRFSVTEEGIKKVMFEGLSGEIISGKVKIGFEDGIPVVKEVTGGSQFITLLPPTGQETFEPSAWYFIVAIPGSLEGGYKLRFYKDSDYARKVSEKAVEIKRSIYGTLDNADEGIEFEPQKTHFPETEEEKEASIVRIENIAEQTKSIIDRLIINHSISDEVELIKGFSSIEGVINCSLNESKDVAYLMLADSVFVNVRLIEDSSKWSDGMINPSIRSAPTKPISKNVTASKRLLILSPYQSEIKNWSAVKCSYLEECLAPLGFQVDSLVDNEVKLDHFCGDHLKQYDVVLITTHGNFNLTVNGRECSAIDTGERVSLGSRVIRYFNRESDISFAIANGVPTYAATAAWIEKTTSDLGPTSFNNSLVLLQACYSYYSDEYYNYFINHGVSAFGGFNRETDKQVSRAIVSKLIFYLSSGVDFKTAAEYVKTADSDVIATYNHVKLEKGDSSDISPENFHFTPNSHYFISDSHPKQLEHKVNSDGKHCFSWVMAPSWGSLLFNIVIDGKTIHEDLEIDDSYDFSDPSNRQLSFSFVPTSFTPSSGERKYPWSIIAKVYVDDEFFASYLSDGEPFSVTEEIHYEPPEAIDLGLPSGTKWASFNLGATKPEEYGYYYAWGETEPKASYSWSNYKWCKGTDHTLTKYCTDSSSGYEGFVDNKTKLDLSDDAARVNLQGYFRTPTCDEMKELFENSSVEWTNSYQGTGEAGYILTSNVPGYTNNSVFLPFAGDSRGNQGQIGNYMMSETTGCVPQGFNSMYLKSDIIYGGGYMNRIHVGSKAEGTTIRPVYPTQVKQITIVPTQTSSYVGNQIVLSTETVPENASHNYVWSSSNESIAKVFSSRDNTCRINLVSPGVATITVTALDGNVSASCQVIVKEEEPKAIINISPTEINYGDVKVGEGLGHETGRVTFTNTGNADLSIFFIDCPDGFSHSTGYTFPIVISPGNDKTIVFAFKPTEVKTYSGYIQVYTNASNGGGTIKVTGNGIE